jgi:putative transposase
VTRPLRIEYPGAIYHVLSRGDRREPIVTGDTDRVHFFDLLDRTCERTAWQVHSCTLMTNHFHLVIETPRANLSVGMQWLLGRYTQQFNQSHRLVGHLFAGRYKALIVDGRNGDYLRQVCDYVHLNPIRAGMVRDTEPLQSYQWSSYPYYLRPARGRPNWLRTDRLFGEHGLSAGRACDRREFSRRMEAMREEANCPRELSSIRRGWKLGAEDFVDWILDRVRINADAEHPPPDRDETEKGKAIRIIRDELKRLAWTESDLARHRKSDPRKSAIARRVRGETAVTLKWIGEALHMGSAGHVASHLRRCRKT